VTFKLDLKKTTAAGTVLELTQLKKASWVVHTYNPSYLEGRVQEDSLGKMLVRPHLNQ
jgi:hypothetical protein